MPEGLLRGPGRPLTGPKALQAFNAMTPGSSSLLCLSCHDGSVAVNGELTIKGRTHPLRATGSITPALEDPFGGVRRGMELEAIIDRRQYGLEWNLPLPKGGLALDNDVKLMVNLEFTQA